MDTQTLMSRAYSGTAKKKFRYMGAIDYHGQKIAQYHNPNLFINDILGENETKQFTSIMIIGTPGTGKTTLATFISHQCHTRRNYFVFHFGRKELLKFDTVMNSLPNQDLILIFDDVSLIFKHIKDPMQRTKILQTLTEARHPNFETTNRKVIVIANVHYMNSMEKMWRAQGSWKFYTDITGDEAQVFNQMTKNRYKHKVDTFMSVVLDQFRKKKFTVSLTNKQKKTYEINKPFRFIMCYDTTKLRFFLVPEEFCKFCVKDANKMKKTQATPREVDELICHYYGEKDGRAGMKLALTIAGVTHQFRNHPVYAYNLAKEILSTFDIDPEEMALYYRTKAQIKDKRLYTIRKKKVDFIKDLEEIKAKSVSPLGLLDHQPINEIDLEL